MSKTTFPKPPDGGWGWVVVCSCFTVTACTRAITRCIPIFFVEFQQHFSKDTSTTAWINSIMDCTTMLFAPIGSLLSTRFGCRATVMFGGLVSSSGFIIASFSPTIEFLYLFLGLMAGLGFALCYSPSIAIVSRYFQRHRLLATGLAMSGNGVGTFVLAPVVQLLIEVYAWRGALLLLGAFVAQLCVCGALLRPLASSATPTAKPGLLGKQPAETAMPVDHYKPPMLCEGAMAAARRGCRGAPACRPELLVLCLSVSLLAYGCITPLVYLVPFAHSVGTPERQAAFLLSLLGVMDIVGTVTYSWLIDRESVAPGVFFFAARCTEMIIFYKHHSTWVRLQHPLSPMGQMSRRDWVMKRRGGGGGDLTGAPHLIPCKQGPAPTTLEHARVTHRVSVSRQARQRSVTISRPCSPRCLRSRRAHCYCAAVGLYGACALALPAMRSFPLLVAFAALYGYFNGACTPLIPVLVADLVEPAGASTAIGLIYAMHALPYLLGPPTAGWLVDLTADYNAAFFLSGAIIMLGSATFALATCASLSSVTCNKGHLKAPSGHGDV
uniref:Monocarboxylate transporter 12-like n=1 Tax=Petromyzon marinus TaxID=7757 RepID=A0AAJ7SZL1_PETMA|nr:monocarboxylate transporter 12-like [Petromyzon marinus]